MGANWKKRCTSAACVQHSTSIHAFLVWREAALCPPQVVARLDMNRISSVIASNGEDKGKQLFRSLFRIMSTRIVTIASALVRAHGCT